MRLWFMAIGRGLVLNEQHCRANASALPQHLPSGGLTAMRDNLRHASLATTSMYLHSDDIKWARQMATVLSIPTR
jgi:hypothetical protein